MSNRNFDSRVIIQRLQDKNYARNLYLYNTTGQRILHNPQNSNSGALRYSTYHDGSQTMYFRGLIGGGMTVDSGGIFGIPPYPGFGAGGAGGSVGPVVTVPSTPSISSILSGNQQLTVSFLAPGSDGGSVITDYQYSTNINAFSSIGSTVAPFIITGLTNGTTYDIALRAVNAVGAGPITSGTGTPATTPGAPNITSILSGNQQLTVSFLAGSDGGSAITDYQYSTNINAFSSIGATVAPFIITGLTNGVTYDIALRAVNAVGAGPISTGTGTPSAGTVVNGWATNIGGPGSDTGNGITTDIFGNVYVIGTNTTSITPPTVVNSYSTVSSGVILTNTFGILSTFGSSASSDLFITKYNNSGIVQWATNIGGTSGDSGNAIASDTSGNIYAIGNYGINTKVNSYSTVSSGIILTSTFGTLNTTASGFDACIVKYNSSGVIQWATNIGGVNADAGNGIATDTFNNIYVTGIYRTSTFINSYNTVSSNIILTNTFGKLLNPSATFTDAFIAKYNSSGIVQWATNIGSTLLVNEVGNKVASDMFGNVYVVGTFNSPSTFVNSYSTVANDSTIVTSLFGRLSTFGTGSDAFIVKYNSSGITQWATTIGGTSTENGNDVAIDLDGNVYVAGSGASQIRINSYSTVSSSLILTSTFAILSTSDTTTDPFIVKYNSSGIAQWATNIGGISNSNPLTNGIAIDTLNNIYFTGTYNNVSTFINSYSTVSSGFIITSTFGTLLGATANRTFTVKYTSSGVVQWATDINGLGTLANRGLKIATDMNNNPFITGSFATSTFINMFSTVSSGIIITSTFGRLISQAGDDAYIVKYDTNGQM